MYNEVFLHKYVFTCLVSDFVSEIKDNNEIDYEFSFRSAKVSSVRRGNTSRTILLYSLSCWMSYRFCYRSLCKTLLTNIKLFVPDNYALLRRLTIVIDIKGTLDVKIFVVMHVLMFLK